MNNRSFETALSALHMHAFIVASWLEGTITGIQTDTTDSDLIIALQVWLDRQRLLWDDFLVGKVCCANCGNEWNTEGFKSRLANLMCPACGVNFNSSAFPK